MSENGAASDAVVIRVIVDYHTGEDGAHVVGPVDDHPEACLLALGHAVKLVAARMHQARRSDIVQVRPKIVRPM